VVEIGGTDVRRLGPAELARVVGVVLTERISVGALSARRVVELGRYPHLGWWGRLDDGDRAAVHSALEASGALRMAERDINELSDGERQRVLIARALAQEPQVLLLDEPTAFVDVPSRVELMGLLRSLAAEKGLAVIVSTHDLELALRLADTIWLVEKGGRIGVGCPEDLVLSGRLAKTFEARGIRFRAEERAFRLVSGNRGRVEVTGQGLLRDLALAVLERQGYSVEPGGGPVQLSVAIATETPDWEAEAEGGSVRGSGFESLARFARAPGSGVVDVVDQVRRAASTRKASSENSIAAP
jgi:iron complex transport system ATP-binding protein